LISLNDYNNTMGGAVDKAYGALQEEVTELHLPSEAVGAAEDIEGETVPDAQKQYRMLRHGGGMVSVIKSRQD
jgi:hypothetical protein